MPETTRTEGWFHPLEGDRLEIFLKVVGPDAPNVKLRASGPESEMYELADWFERVTGLTVSGDVRKWRRGSAPPRPVTGQESFEFPELSLDATVDDHGSVS
jgi:hypothetical protein